MKNPFVLLIGSLALLFIAWLATGGPQQATQTGSVDDKFIEPLNPIQPTGTYDEPIWDPERGVWQNPILRSDR